MDKKEFTTELKDLLSSMSEEEIEKTLNALNGCKTAICKKNNQEKGEKARLLSTTDRNESELHFVRGKNKEGTIKAIGASLLTAFDFEEAKKVLPRIVDNWWLYDKQRVSDNCSEWYYNENTGGKIRPVIIVDEIKGDLQPGEEFSINNESFRYISPSLIIRNNCLDDLCTYNALNYECSILKLCVDGWYMKLIRENQSSAGSTET